MTTGVTSKYLSFIAIVFALSIPFWILGALAGDVTKTLPINLPISALMTFCPLLAAIILLHKEKGSKGVKELVKLSFDINKIKNKKWYIPVIFLMPVIALISYWYVKMGGAIQPAAKVSLLSVVVFFILFFIGAIGEELGWSGYIIDSLQSRYGAFKASIIVGSAWAVWHIIPYYQAHQTTEWIVWQCIGTVFLRTVMVWLFNNTGKSVFAMVLFHAMINISPYLIPNYGGHYNPFIFTILIIITAIKVTLLWGPKTLSHFRLGKLE